MYFTKILNCQNRDQRTNTRAQGGVQTQLEKYWKVFQNPLIKNYNATISDITMLSSLCNVD